MTHDLRVERVLDAAPEAVFDAFTDPDAQQEMYADAPDWVVRSECDLRVGGRWTIEFGPPDQPPSREACVFEVVERPVRLVYSSTMTMPDGSSIDTRTQVTFERTSGGQTRVTIEQSGFPSAGWRDEFIDGWGGILAGLARAVAAGSA
ncbi:MAG TPA: SRPBCC domain-containing protein [Streptosporangiaceae bacterium]